MGATLRIGLAALALGLALSGAGRPAWAAWQVLRTPRVLVYFTGGYEAASPRVGRQFP